MVRLLFISILLVGCSENNLPLKVDLKVDKACKSDKWSVSYCKLVNKSGHEVCFRSEYKLNEGEATFTIPCSFYEGI